IDFAADGAIASSYMGSALPFRVANLNVKRSCRSSGPPLASGARGRVPPPPTTVAVASAFHPSCIYGNGHGVCVPSGPDNVSALDTAHQGLLLIDGSSPVAECLAA